MHKTYDPIILGPLLPTEFCGCFLIACNTFSSPGKARRLMCEAAGSIQLCLLTGLMVMHGVVSTFGQNSGLKTFVSAAVAG